MTQVRYKAAILSLFIAWSTIAPLAVGAPPAPTTKGVSADVAPACVLKGCGGLWVSFSPNGSLLATGGAEGVRLWDTKTFRSVGGLISVKLGDGCTPRFTENGRFFANDENGGHLYDVASGRLLRDFRLSAGTVQGAGITSNGAFVYEAYDLSDERRWCFHIAVWHAGEGRKMWERTFDDPFIFSCFSPDGQSMVLEASVPECAREYRLLSTIDGHDLVHPITIQDIHAVNHLGHYPAFAADGALLALTSSQAIDIVQTTSGRVVLHVADEEMDMEPQTVAFSVDGKAISIRGTILRDCKTGEVIPGAIRQLTWRHRFDPAFARLVGDPSVQRDGQVMSIPMGPTYSIDRAVGGNAVSGLALAPLVGYYAFSPDRKLFAITADFGGTDTFIWKVNPNDIIAEKTRGGSLNANDGGGDTPASSEPTPSPIR